MLQREEIIEILKKTGVMLEGHFLLTSGRHSNRYMQCAQLFQYPQYSEMLCRELIRNFEHEKIDVVVGPPWAALSSPMRWRPAWACATSSLSARTAR